MKPRKILAYVILAVMLVYFGVKLYVQYKPVKIYVSRISQMPTELAEGLHMEEHKISSKVRIESLYENSDDKPLPLEEIRRVRARFAWGLQFPFFPNSIVIMNTNRVVARRMTDRFMEECELINTDSEWVVKSRMWTRVNTHTATE